MSKYAFEDLLKLHGENVGITAWLPSVFSACVIGMLPAQRGVEVRLPMQSLLLLLSKADTQQFWTEVLRSKQTSADVEEFCLIFDLG